MSSLSRRDFFRAAGVGSIALSIPNFLLGQDAQPAAAAEFTLPKLPYAVDALEPHIDAKTMEIHHGRHHKAYVDNLNKAIAGTEWTAKPIDKIVADLANVPEKLRTAVQNNGGGHFNHTLFWNMLSPKGGKPSGGLNDAIANAFVDLPKMLEQLKDAAMKRFGSGWGWVVVAKGEGGKKVLKIVSTANQDNPLTQGMIPILGVDVWEHAYYLKYQNRRADYLDAFMKVINWEYVVELYEAAMKA